MLQFCFWLSLSNHSPGNQVVHLSLVQPLLQQHLPGVVCANIKTLTGVCKYKNPAQCTSIENPPSVCKNQNTSNISPCVQTKLYCVWGIRRGCWGSAQHWGRAWHPSREERIPERQEIVE